MQPVKFFKVTDGILELDRDEVRAYKPFARLLSRDKGSPGDSDGRKKLQAFREFKYIYFTCDINAFPRKNGLDAKEAHLYAIEQADLPNGYLPDKEVQEAMSFYVEHTSTPIREFVTDLLIAINNNRKVVAFMTKRISAKLEALEKEFKEEDVTAIYTIQKDLMAMANTIPATIKSLTDALELISKEETKMSQVMFGGESVPDSANPETSY